MGFSRVAVFALGIFVTTLTVFGVRIYGLDQYEQFGGRGGSLQVSLWIAVFEAIICAVGFALGARIFHGFGKVWRVFLVGVLVGGTLLLLASLIKPLVSTTSGRQILTILLAFGVSLFSAILFRGRESVSE